jgi:hypothetical protein
MMRARDSAFMVDHRRQLSLPPPGVAGAAAAKKDEVAKKKKAGQHLQHQRAQQKSAPPPPNSNASGKAPGPTSVKKSAKESGGEDAGTPVPAPSSKKSTFYSPPGGEHVPARASNHSIPLSAYSSEQAAAEARAERESIQGGGGGREIPGEPEL